MALSLVLADSNFYIRSSREGHDPFEVLAQASEDMDFAICGMVRLEVLRGLREPKIRNLFEQRFELMVNIATDDNVWKKAHELAWTLDRQGMILPAQDILIGACALVYRAAVLTFDRHFYAIPGLTVLESLP